jgi:colanic acid/amylovoran biosynthesis glycosyltransferase
MNNPKVAHLLYSFLPVTQNWIYNQLMFNKGVDSLVMCQYHENTEQFHFNPVYNFYPGINIWTKFKLFLTRLHLWYPYKYIEEIVKLECPDILHGHFATESFKLIDISKRSHLPLVTTFYGLDVNKLSKRKIWKKSYSRLFETGKLFIVEGHHMAEQLRILGCPPDRIKVIHIGIDIEKIENLQPPVVNRDNLRILFIGLERQKKGAIDAVKAFSIAAHQCPEIELHIIGDGKYKKQVEKIIKSEGLADRVVLHGFTSVEKYLGILMSSDILLAPSCIADDGDTEGGAPVVTIEAQAAGKPVISTFHCDIPEVVIDKKTGLLSNEHDILRIADSIVLLVKDENMRIKMGLEGRKHVRRNHNIINQVSILSELYRSLCERK